MSDFKPPIENFLVRDEWRKRGWVAWSLTPFACVFGLIAAIRRAFFALGWIKQVNVGVPVVVVGNVTVGGTGKTPTVIALVEALHAAGFQPGVVSRGYGAKIHEATRVTPDSQPSDVGDEPLLIARRTHAPVMVSPDRVAAAQALLKANPSVDVIVSDDGLQHYRLARAFELVVFDDRLGGNGFLLPAGPLRESMSRHRDATLINSPYDRALPPWPNTFSLDLATGDAWLLDDPAVRRPLSAFKGEQIAAAAGIGSPERFFASLRAAGLVPVTRAFPDHYDYRDNPFYSIDADSILITEKDAVKFGAWRDARIWVVPVEAVLSPRLIALVVEKLRGRTPA